MMMYLNDKTPPPIFLQNLDYSCLFGLLCLSSWKILTVLKYYQKFLF